MDRPKIFYWWDALTFGLAAVVATVLVLIAQFNGLNDDVPLWRWLGTWSVVVGFWAGYGMVLKWRRDLVKRIAYDIDGVVFIHDGGEMPSREDAEKVVHDTLVRWNTAMAEPYKNGIVKEWPSVEVYDKGVLVFVKPLPFTLHTQPGKFAGVSKPWRKAVAVGIGSGKTVEQSALGHELGHCILYYLGLPADEDALKLVANTHNLPY